MRAVKTGAIQAAAGVYCALLGAMMLVIPQQFAGDAFAALQPALPVWGLLFFAAGISLLAVCLLGWRGGTAVAHAAVATTFLVLAVSAAGKATWPAAVAYLALAVGVAASAVRNWVTAAPTPRRGIGLVTACLGASAVVVGAIVLIQPSQLGTPALADIKPTTMVGLGAALVFIGAATLATVFLPVPEYLSPWPSVALGLICLARLAFAPSPRQYWPGLLYFLEFGLLLIALPWSGPRLRQIDPTSLRTRLVLALGASATLPLMFVAVVAADRQERALLGPGLLVQQAAAQAVATNLTDDLALREAATLGLAARPELFAGGPDASGEALATAERAYGGRFRFAAYDRDGRLEATAPASGVPFPDRLTAPPATGGDTLDRPAGAGPGQMVLTAPLPGAGGVPMGYVASQLDPLWWGHLLERTRVADGFRFLVVNRAGSILADPRGGAGPALGLDSPLIAAVRAAGPTPGALTLREQGTQWLAGYAPVPGTDWAVLLLSPEPVAARAMRASGEVSFLVMLAALAAAGVAGWLIATRLTAPIKALAEAVDRLAEGDDTAPLPSQCSMEFERLADHFRTMRERLATRTAEREEAQAQVQSMNAELEERVADRTADLEVAVQRLEQEAAERGRVSAALQASEERYRSVVANVTEVIFQTDADGRWTFLNPAWTAITGFAVEATLGTLFLNYVHPADRDRNQALFLPLIQRRKEYCRHEVRYLTRDGSFRWIEVYARLTLDADGQVVGTSGTLNDVTDRRRAEAEVEAQRDFALQVMNTMGQGLTVTDAGSRFEYVNPAYARMVGREPAELAGLRPSDLTVSDDLTVLATARLRRRLGEVSTYETQLRRPDGSTVPVLITGVPRWRDGAVAGAIAVITDLTNRKRAEAAIERERATLDSVLTSMSDGLILVGADDRISYGNAQAYAILDADGADLVGRTVTEVFAALREPESQTGSDATWPEWQEAKARATAGPLLEVRCTTPVQRDIQAQLFTVPPPAGEDATPGVGLVLRDVTVERDLARTKDELVAVVSHELRTPLASLVGFAELLLSREYPEPQRRRFLAVIHEEGERLTALINDFLDLERMANGRSDYRLAPVDPAALLTRAIEHFGFDPKLPVSLDGPPALPSVLVDEDRILQVLTNILSNARKYSPNGGIIRLGARIGDDMLEISVADSGLGLPPEALSRLFEKFYRVDNSDRRTIKGTGLGLAICQQIVTAHGGRIWAESAGLGQGTTVRFTLPLAKVGAGGGHVLVVEDDPAFAQLLEAELGRFGLAAVRAASVEAALTQIERNRPQAIVLDLAFPQFSGDDVLVHLATTAESMIPTVVVTARDLARDEVRRLRRLGALTVLRKGPRAAADAAALMAHIVSEDWDPDDFEDDRWLRRDTGPLPPELRLANSAGTGDLAPVETLPVTGAVAAGPAETPR